MVNLYRLNKLQHENIKNLYRVSYMLFYLFESSLCVCVCVLWTNLVCAMNRKHKIVKIE